MKLTSAQLAYLRAELIEQGTVHIERKHREQVEEYLSQEHLSVKVTPSGWGCRVELLTRG